MSSIISCTLNRSHSRTCWNWEKPVSRITIGVMTFCGLAVAGASGCASLHPCTTCYPPAVDDGGTEIARQPFDGSTYSFDPPGAYSTNYGPPPINDYPYRLPYVYNYYGPFPRAAARDRLTPFYQPGPYYYTRTPPYVPSYYGYYSSPDYLRY